MAATRCLPYDDDAIAAGAAIIAGGGVVAVPTETVYGLAGDATRPDAVAAIFAAKGRPQFNPLIIHVADLGAARAIGIFDAASTALAHAHWPGPLTLVVPLRRDSGIAPLATAGLETVALRVPAHRAMRAMLAATGRPLAAPSANASGAISPTRAAHVMRSLDGRIPLVIDDGATTAGIESTIVASDGAGLRLLRPGPIEISGAVTGTSATIEAPGQLEAHYAPSKPLRLDAVTATGNEWLIGFGAVAGDASLSAAGDVVEAAAQLFERLHEADAGPCARIAVAPVPRHGLGIAINDRLRRAAAGARVDTAA